MKLGMLQAYGMLFSLAILFNVFIAALLSISPENCCGDESLTFVDNFYFTFQTFATIGYGTLSPVGIWANFLTFAIQIVYVFWMTITGGMVVTKFLASGAQIDFSEQLVINQEGKFPELMIRVANAHMNVYTIHHCSATIRLLLNTGSYSSINLLKLESDQADRLLVWTLSHEINQESPLYGLTFEVLAQISFTYVRQPIPFLHIHIAWRDTVWCGLSWCSLIITLIITLIIIIMFLYDVCMYVYRTLSNAVQDSSSHFKVNAQIVCFYVRHSPRAVRDRESTHKRVRERDRERQKVDI